MKKFTTLFLLLLIVNGVIYSQSLRFVREGVVLENNATVIENEVTTGLIKSKVHIKNEGSTAIINASLKVIVDGDATEIIGYCGWGNTGCFPVAPGGEFSSTTTIAAGEEIDPIIEAMDVDENSLNKVQYILSYDGQEQTLNVVFTTQTTSLPTNESAFQINVNQKGANTEIIYSFDSAKERQINVYDLTGKTVLNETISNTEGLVVLPKLNKGIYIYSLTEQDKKIETKKFVVR